jgi:hypothetical protein
MRHSTDLTPILDRELQNGDDYLAKLGRWIDNARHAHASRNQAALDWIN